MAESLRGVRVLVTGATGFLGAHLTRRLHGEGALVHVMLRPGGARQRIADLLPSLQCVEANLGDTPAVERALATAAPRVVFHLAASTSSRGGRGGGADELVERYEANVTDTMRFLAVLASRSPALGRVVRTGGLEEYGSGPLPYREDQREAPVSAYSAGQVAVTHFCEMLHRRTALPIVTLRPALTYGPGQSTSFFIPSLIDACLEGRAFRMTAGLQTRDLVYVDDVIDACMAAAIVSGIDGRVINIGTGDEACLRDVAARIVELTGGGDILRLGALPDSPGDLARLVCDPSLAASLLQWRARTSLDSGLSRTIAHSRAVRASARPGASTPAGR